MTNDLDMCYDVRCGGQARMEPHKSRKKMEKNNNNLTRVEKQYGTTLDYHGPWERRRKGTKPKAGKGTARPEDATTTTAFLAPSISICP